VDELTARLAAAEARVATADAVLRDVDRVLAEHIGRFAELRNEVERIAAIQSEAIKAIDSLCPGLLPASIRPAHPAGSS
jgi:hypothetical protein